MAYHHHIDNDWISVHHSDAAEAIAHTGAHTRKREPQFNSSNISSTQAANASAALFELVHYSPDNKAESSKSTETATTGQDTVKDGAIKVMPMGLVAALPSWHKSPMEAGSQPADGLTSLSLHLLSRQYEVCYPRNMEEWLAGHGPARQLAGCGTPSLSDSRLAHKSSSKPSVASSDYHDGVMVLPPNAMEDIIKAAGSQFQNDPMDASIDRDFLTLI